MIEKEHFSNRWGIVLASLGMAIGAGNLWRFPRLAGQYGGSFIILWILFLLVWSIPILLAEFSIGKKYQKGVIGAFAETLGKKYTWVGFFITACTLFICFYYAVVTSWGLQYLGFSLKNAYREINDQPLSRVMEKTPDFFNTHWHQVSNGNMITVLLYALVVIAGTYLLVKGIQKGLEKANKILIPSLFVLLILITVIALNMENGTKGLEYMFTIDVKLFSEPKIWIEALSQSAWSTGAGWGLMMTISSYSRKREDVTLNTFIGAFGNNTASLMAAMAILPAVFAISQSDAQAVEYLQSGNQALTFTIIPKLFATVPGGYFLSIIFFLAFFLAAFSSLLPMLELFIRNIRDLGISRNAAATRAAIFTIVFALPSAWYLDFFNNQDWVWGIGLIISGLFFVFAALKNGVLKFKKNFIDEDSDYKVPNLYFVACMSFNVVLGIVLIYWWMSQGYSQYPWFDQYGNWNFFDVYSNATIITQWVIVLAVGIAINKFLYRKFVNNPKLNKPDLDKSNLDKPL